MHFNFAYFPGFIFYADKVMVTGKFHKFVGIYFCDSTQIPKIWCTRKYSVLQYRMSNGNGTSLLMTVSPISGLSIQTVPMHTHTSHRYGLRLFP